MDRSRSLLVVAVLIALSVGAGWLLFQAEVLPQAPATHATEVQAFQKRAARYLSDVCGPDGQFIYQVHMDPRMVVKPKYNMLRHAGSIYALATYEQRTPTEQNKAAILRAVKFLRENIGPVEGEDGLLTLWSRPEVARTSSPVQAKLGGSGLALVALTQVEVFAPGTTPLEDLRQLARFILFMQKPDGSFYSKYVPSTVGRDDSWTSLYYPGEAALGLVRLYELDPNLMWLKGAANALGYLSRMRQGKDRVEPDHWALLATTRLLQHHQKLPPDAPPVKLLKAHAIQIVNTMLNGAPDHRGNPRLEGCMGPDGRTCPTATRLEGLLGACEFLSPEEYPQLRPKMDQAIKKGIAFLMAAQVTTGPYAGGVPWAVMELESESRKFNDQVGEIRIDYVQHALSAVMQYEDLFVN